MKITISLLLWGFLFLFPLTNLQAQQDDKAVAETVVHLLSYVAMDYPGAVQNGEIINDPEYLEQQEFAEEAYVLVKETSLEQEVKTELLNQLKELQQLIDQKASEEDISRTANQVNNKIIELTGIETAPKVWPDFAKGKILYSQNCASCHGDNGKGDGPAGVVLEPAPSNFHDDNFIENFSPYQAYNSIRFGLPGTAMRAYSELNDNELWNLSFYIKSLHYQEKESDSVYLQEVFSEIKSDIGLATVATSTDKELREELDSAEKEAEAQLQALRTMEPEQKEAFNSLPIASDHLEKAHESYAQGNNKLARTQVINAYLEGIEPVEARLRSIDKKFVAEIEAQMFQVRQVLSKDKGIAVFETEMEKAFKLIEEAEGLLQDQQLNFWLTFLIAGSIFLREGLEAFLILAVILALIRSANAKQALPWLHGGWITAVIAGIAGWFASDYILQFGGKNREVMEGVISLVAVLVLVYVGFWLHSKSSAKQWTKFIKEKVEDLLKTEKMFGLAVFSFVIVFREAFEVILFLQAIKLEAGPENQTAIGFGVIAAVVVIALIAYLFLKYSKMISVRKLFRYSDRKSTRLNSSHVAISYAVF